MAVPNATPITRLSKLTGISAARLWTIYRGGPFSRAELDALARAWAIPAGELAASLPLDMLVVE